MTEGPHAKFLPGSEIPLRLEIRHPVLFLDEAGVVFRHAEDPTYELVAGGVPEPTGTPAPLSSPDEPGETSVALMVLEVPGRAPRGIYKVDRLWVQTRGGRFHRYRGEELGDMSGFTFEVLEEPDAKPDLRLGYR